MAHAPSSNPAPLTEEAFFADRMAFWSGFCNFATVCTVLLALLMAAMAFFLV